MGIGKAAAVRNAKEVIESTYPVTSADYEVTGTHHASGRWRITYDVDGVSDNPRVRIDDETGELAEESDNHHGKTSYLPGT